MKLFRHCCFSLITLLPVFVVFWCVKTLAINPGPIATMIAIDRYRHSIMLFLTLWISVILAAISGLIIYSYINSRQAR